MGTSGDEIIMSIPRFELDDYGGANITGARAFTLLSAAQTGGLEQLDELGLPDSRIEHSRVRIGIGRAGAADDEFRFDHITFLGASGFGATIETDGLEPGDYEILARACVADVCGSARTRVTID